MTHEPERPDDLDIPPVSLTALSREMDPPHELEERVVQGLHDRGLLRRPAPRRTRRFTAGWALAAALAGLALFAGGFASGQRMGARTTLETVVALRDGDAAQRAARLQRTGSLYVQAMNALHDGTGSPGAQPGHEVALATLRAAVAELVRLSPDDARLRQVLDLLDGTQGGAGPTDGPSSSVLWF